MQGATLRRVAALGLAFALVGVVVPGFHHVRCTAVLLPDAPREPASCVTTFPWEVAVAAGLGGIAGALAALGAGLALASRSDRRGPRMLLALAAITLAVPALTILAGWGSAGFDLRFAEADGSCHGSSLGRSPPLWLQTSMCVNAYDALRVPLLVVAGIAAALGALGLDRRALLVGVAAGGLAVLTIVVAIALDAAAVGLVWSLPILGTLLLAGAAALARRQQAHPDVPPA